MKKNIISVLTIINIITMLSSCAFGNSLKKNYKYVQYHASESTTYAVYSTTAPRNNEISYEDLISKKLDIHYFIENYLVNGKGYYMHDIDEIATDIGIECLRETDAGALYSVHKVKQGGLLYLFYSNFDLGEKGNDIGDCIGWFYVKKKLSSHDFSAIKAGSNIDDIIKIDPTVQIYKNIFETEEYSGISNPLPCYSEHYLEDGILKISYEIKDGNFIVTNCIMDDFYISDGFSGMVRGEYDGSVLPIDRVHDE